MTTEKQLRQYSKVLAKVLRHNPELWGITIDYHGGWTDVEALLAEAGKHGVPLTREILDEVVETNNKHRYDYNADGTKIRANQGHSVPVDLELAPAEPPEFLFHGTTGAFLDSILREGLKPMSRNHVHLSPDEATAENVGARHGKPVILRVKTGEMSRAGYTFWLSANGVWLTEHVPPEYLEQI